MERLLNGGNSSGFYYVTKTSMAIAMNVNKASQSIYRLFVASAIN